MGRKLVFASALTDVATAPKEALGTIREENNAVYKYVQFSGTTTVAAGDFCSYVIYASDPGLNIVDKATALIGAGLAMAAVASGTVQYGWIQIKGLGTLASAFGSGANGNAVTVIGASNGTLVVAAAVTNHIVGQIHDVTAKQVVLDCPY